MQTLTLLRHAKSGYVNGLTDFKRHLTESGRRDALNMAMCLHGRGYIPTAILTSSAVRTRETAQILREAMGLAESSVTHLSELYLASPDDLIRVINTAVDVPHLMLVAHNPGLELLSTMLDPDSPERMGACSLNHFELTTPDANAESRSDSRQTKSSQAARNSVEEESGSPSQGHDRLEIRNAQIACLNFHEQPYR